MIFARETARAIAEGALAAADVLARAADVVAAREGEVGAFVAFARAAAEGAPSPQRPLHGLPFAVKDNFATAEFRTGHGAAEIFAGHRTPLDAAAVALARRAGAVLVGKAAMTELALYTPAATRNPHRAGHTPGGSSSGSAAAVAAGMVAFALGTQTAGSVVRPAAFCGVAGFKPTFGLIPTAGLKLGAPSLDTAGIFAASVADAAFVFEAMTGRPASEPMSPRIGVVARWAGAEPEEAGAAALERAAAAAASTGAAVAALRLSPEVEAAHAAQETVMAYEIGRNLLPERLTHGEALSAAVRDFIDRGLSVAAEDYDHATATIAAARRAVAALFAEVDILITPSAPGAAPRGLASTGSPRFNQLWTALHLPAVNIPGLSTAEGLPLGVQAVGAAGADAATLAAAAFVERAIGVAGADASAYVQRSAP